MPFSKEFLEANLDYKIDSFEESAGSAIGDNYATILKSIKIKPTHGDEDIHLVTKILPTNLGRVEFLKRANIFYKELQFYEWWMPKIENLQKCLGRENIILPTLPPFLFGYSENWEDYKHVETMDENGLVQMEVGDRTTPDSDNCLFMTDVRKSMGYKLANRLIGLNLNETNVLMKEIAIFHAISWVYKCKNGIEKLTDVYPLFIDKFSGIKTDKMFRQFQELAINTGLETVESTMKGMEKGEIALEAVKVFAKKIQEIEANFTGKDGTDERYLESFLRIKDTKKLEDSDAVPWLVVCHGDFAMHNVLFKYDDEGRALNAMLLDLQIMREACPTTDLAYMLYLSTTHTLRLNHLPEILKTYFDEFVSVCEQLNVPLLPGFTFESLQRRFRRAKMFGFLNGFCFLPMALKPPEEAVDMETVRSKDSHEFANAFFKNSSENPNLNLQNRLIGLINEVYDEGII